MGRIKQNKRNFKRAQANPFPELNIMEQQRIVEGVARKINKEKLAREIARELSQEVLTAECKQQITDEAVSGALMVFSNILLNHWKELTPRNTRIKVMYDLFKPIFSAGENPDEQQLAAEAEFEKQTGLKVIRDKET